MQAAFRTLPERYLGAERDFDATYHIRLGDIGHTWEVRCTTHGARVRAGVTGRDADVVIGTDADTWLRLRRGELSGRRGVLAAPALRPRRRSTWRSASRACSGSPTAARRCSASTTSVLEQASASRRSRWARGPTCCCCTGWARTKASFFDTAAALSHSYRVHAIDLPGFGGSCKPALARYGAPFFARAVLGAMDALRIERAHLIGNSMGGRVALEVGLREPGRVGGLALLCPALAFVRRGWHPLVRLLRPELGLLPHSLGRGRIERQFWSMFADRDLVDPSVADIVVDEFERIYRSAGARLAFLSSARSIYLDPPFGRDGLFPRLEALEPAAMFVWGSHDKLIPPGFSRHVERWLPGAEQIVLEGCGHVPQVERPERTNGLITRFFARIDALGAAPPARERVAA